ncbi:hypothetical protein E1B28_013695 [Marasmius oreades]|uniref:Uncharacterized protein n=1 Tax=Marasmius oreades TaxID=181124 RepID=A0A9P7UQ57_9AGAR|nr:uncharacterized protein E1B28_013695 [Marasmius oreades]KAG7087754.1 hypothetical protein E1B28_013695 [Marasmius oreades]
MVIEAVGRSAEPVKSQYSLVQTWGFRQPQIPDSPRHSHSAEQGQYSGNPQVQSLELEKSNLLVPGFRQLPNTVKARKDHRPSLGTRIYKQQGQLSSAWRVTAAVPPESQTCSLNCG